MTSGQVPGLQLVWQTPQWRLWRVQGSPGLVTGAATLTSLEPDHLTLQVSQPGPITVRVRYTAFWSVTRGMACLAAGTGGWTNINALSVGPMALSAKVLHPSAPAYCPAALARRPTGPPAAARPGQPARNSSAPRSSAWQPCRLTMVIHASSLVSDWRSSMEEAMAVTSPSRL